MELVSERCIASLLNRVLEVKPTEVRKILTKNTTILEHQNNKQKLQILEALHIRNMQPKINRINFPQMMAQSQAECTWEINNHEIDTAI